MNIAKILDFSLCTTVTLVGYPLGSAEMQKTPQKSTYLEAAGKVFWCAHAAEIDTQGCRTCAYPWQMFYSWTVQIPTRKNS